MTMPLDVLAVDTDAGNVLVLAPPPPHQQWNDKIRGQENKQG